MTVILWILVIVLISAVILVSVLKKARNMRKAARFAFHDAPPPPPIAERGSPAYRLAERLRQSIPDAYSQAVKQRVMEAHPGMTEREYDWRWLELQRFFVMCAILDRVPMFSRAVDEVWHEMLMYTREYQSFADSYLKRMLHHTPNAAKAVPMPEERAWFDWLYLELFGWERYSELLWGAFLRHPLPRRELEAFRIPAAETGNVRFNAWAFEHVPEARSAIGNVKDKLRSRIGAAEQLGSEGLRKRADFTHPEMLLYSFIFFSWSDPKHYNEFLRPPAMGDTRSGSTCSGAACASGRDERGDAGGDHSGCDGGGSGTGSDDGSSCSGGSSCSSCGGGCSS
ncbi:hypothetical protein [Paenibacillus macerans]|uniref:hypothetical protein n=1 Tax=Paenibacillus macerans TaxID=44252 RepID=UPI002041AF32|nr:hypothetical protein [Paenibacillus macerans]MCM3703685.1 hypothetical protein [Paenibacillus macerans]